MTASQHPDSLFAGQPDGLLRKRLKLIIVILTTLLIILIGIVLLMPVYLPGFAVHAPVLDGRISPNEWDDALLVKQLPHGTLHYLNDETTLYMLLDIPADTVEDDTQRDYPWGDYFWLVFDVNGNQAIDPELDFFYTPADPPQTLVRSFYAKPAVFTPVRPTHSQVAAGFGTTPNDATPHRYWEIAIQLDEIHAISGEAVRLGVQVYSVQPAIVDLVPENLYVDMHDFLMLRLARRESLFNFIFRQ
jgi:hypothetical protein